ncbi:MAG: peptidase M3 [Deltaproteobacteria bacterium]|nr:MAG: peptidase M3 [Deltaproteobacteria bacterium]
MTRCTLLSIAALALAACPKQDTPVSPTPAAAAAPQPPAEPAPEAAPAPAEPAEAAPAPDPSAQFLTECRAGLNRARQTLDAILAVDGDRTLANTLVPYDEMIMHLETSWGMALLWRNVHPDPQIRSAAAQCEQECAAFQTEISLNRDLYDAIAALDTSGFDPLAKRVVDHTLRDFRRAGVDKDPQTRARLKELDEQIIAAAQKFNTALNDDVRSITVDSVDDLAGLPQDWIDDHPPGKDGKITITTRYPDYFPVATYAKSEDVRRRIYLAARSRGDQHKDVLRTILKLRWEKAHLLGYKDFADYYIEDKMMKSGDNAARFIDRVWRLARSRARRDYRALLARKRKDDPKAKAVADWDKTYYENLIKAEKYDYDAQAVRQYYPYEAVRDGLLAVTGEIFDVSYVPVEDPRTWHEDVDVYDVMRGGEKIGRIFLDMHPRDGKYSHAAQFPLSPGVKGKSLPEGALVCNFPKTFMEQDDVETMFHEFGHLMHHIFKGQREWMTLGEVERDFVEAPSQIFEEWARNYEVLSRFAKNPDTGETIPKELVDRMNKADEFGRGISTVYQMYYAAMVLEFYRRDPDKLDMDALNRELMEKYTPFAYVPGTNRYMQIGQIVGYPASYYTYMWSLVLAKDLFSPFAKHGLLNKEWTHRYRDRVLAPGGSKDAAELIRDFLGRPWNYKAFERWLKG